MTDTRERILQEASRLYMPGSYEAVSMQVIADHLDISKATIFHHFKNKQELFFEMWLLIVTRFQQLLEDAVANSEEAPIQTTLRGILLCFTRASGIDIQRMVQDVASHLTQEQHEQLQSRWRASFALVLGVLERGIERGELRPHDPHLATYALLHLGRLMPTSARPRLFPQPSLSQDTYIDALLDMFLNGLHAEPQQEHL